MKRVLCLLFFSCLPIACETTRDQYYWGEYENMVDGSFETKGGADPEAQVQKLEEMIQRAADRDQKVPPGVYAHLGYMKHLIGDDPGSVLALNHEKELYPSSTVFVDRLLGNVKMSPAVSKKTGKK